jgi:hypothetical protein
MTLREKLLYHHIHPAKMATDAICAMAAAVLLWQQHLLRAIAVGLGPPIVVSLLVLQFANLEKLKESPLGRYAGRTMTAATDIVRVLGAFVFWGGAWYRSVFWCIVGLLIIAFVWVRGRLPRVRI